MKTPILGSSYVARSVNAADNRMVNLFPEIVPEGGKEPGFLNRTPGLRLQLAVGIGPIRGEWVMNGKAYVVSGVRLYKIDSNWDVTNIGFIVGHGPVSMADNGIQLFIACNGPSYIYNTATEVLGQISDPDFPGAVIVGYLSGYFVFNEPDSQRIWITELLDGTSIDPLDFTSAEGAPDGVVAVFIDHLEAWVFGTSSIEVRYISDSLDFPLQPIQGAFIEIGCASPYSIAKLDNSIFWLGSDARGRGIIYRANGYTPQRISTHAIEWQIQQAGVDLSTAVGYTYQQEGHAFYVLNITGLDTTFVYDVSTGSWHERAGFDNGIFVRHRGNTQMVFNDKIIIGDYQNGNLYSFDLDTYADNGQIQKWLRSWRALPTGQNNLNRTAQHSLQLDCETGVGLITGQGSDPEVMLRWSDDGGHTWSNEHWRSMGRIGKYGYRTYWRRLGMTEKIRDRVYEVSGTDPVKIVITGAELLMSGTNA